MTRKTQSTRRSPVFGALAAFAVGCGNEPPVQAPDASTDASAPEAVAAARQASAAANAITRENARQGLPPTVDVDPSLRPCRSDGPPYTCSPCMVGGPCDTGIPCRLGRTTACIVDRPVCTDTGPAANGTTCGAMGSGMVCTAGACGCPAGQQNCGGVCRISGTCTVGVGGCAVTGAWTCSGTNAVCSATPAPPQAETCNGVDDNCNGVIDDITSVSCAPATCQIGATYCMAGMTGCARTGNSPAGMACAGVTGGVCDGLGTCVCPAGQTNCGGTCRPTGTFCTVGVGACARSGTIVCSGAGTVCSATPGAPTAESCNGVDDNCDGAVDNIAATPCSPNACQTGVLACAGASTVCVATANRPFGTSCAPPSAGVCNGGGACVCPAGTGLCGGICTAGVGNACTVGTGVCQRWGSLVCTGAGAAGCSVGAGGPSEAPERTCNNGLDDDCDGLVDLADPDCPRGPPNDFCINATPIGLTPSVPVSFSGSTATAQHEMDGTCGASTMSSDVYYSFTVTERSLVYADAFGSSYNTVLFFTPFCGGAQPWGFACNDDACASNSSQIVQVLNPGTYYLVVSGFNGSRGNFNVNMQMLPASDRAFQIGSGNNWYGGNTSGLSNRHTPGCATSNAPDETWYHVSCPWYPGGGMYAGTCGMAGWDTMLAFRQGNAWGGPSACNDDSCGLQSQIWSGVTGGAGIRAVYVDGYSSAQGGYTVNINLP